MHLEIPVPPPSTYIELHVPACLNSGDFSFANNNQMETVFIQED